VIADFIDSFWRCRRSLPFEKIVVEIPFRGEVRIHSRVDRPTRDRISKTAYSWSNSAQRRPRDIFSGGYHG